MQRNVVIGEGVECKASDWNAASDSIKGRIPRKRQGARTRNRSDP